MISFKSSMTRTAAALALSSGIMFSACAGPQPKVEPHQIVKKSEVLSGVKKSEVLSNVKKSEVLSNVKKSEVLSGVKKAKTASNPIVNKAQSAFIDKFVKNFDKGTFKEGFASMKQSSTSIVTVDYMLVGKDSDYAEDMVDKKGKEIEYEFSPNSEVGKILVMFNKPVTLGNAIDIANGIYETHFSSVSGMKDPTFKPKRGSNGRLTGNVETIVFWIVRKR
jgi:hypothetical protein